MGFTTGSTIPDTIDTVSLTVNDPSHPVFAGIPLDAEGNMTDAYGNIVTWDDGADGIVQQGISVNIDPVDGFGRCRHRNGSHRRRDDRRRVARGSDHGQ